MNSFPYLGLGALLALALAISNCSSSNDEQQAEGPPPAACSSDKDCRAQDLLCETNRRVCVECLATNHCDDDQICSSNACVDVTPCKSSRDCADDQVCSDSLQRCVECVEDVDCEDGEVCNGEVCRASCQSDKDCQALDLLCDQAAGVCVDCTDHDDCATHEYCSAAGDCVVDDCDPGEAQCEGDSLVVCNAEGSGFSSKLCANGCDAEGDACEGEPSGAGGRAGGGNEAGATALTGGSTGNGGNGNGGTAAAEGGSPSRGGLSGTGGVGSGDAGETGSGGAQSTGGTGPGTGGMDNPCATRTLPVTFRDFTAAHPDFLPPVLGQLMEGIVSEELDSAGKPVAVKTGSAVHIESVKTFAEWYTDGPGRATIPGEIVLYDDGNGGFVNRWGPNGEFWKAHDQLAYCGFEGSACSECLIREGFSCIDPCPSWFTGGSCTGIELLMDGNPLFFPIDDSELALSAPDEEARIPEEYGGRGWPWERTYLNTPTKFHNFLFTTEIHFEFTYDASRQQRFSFLGDDDLWVFLNDRLIIDLGGWHVPLAGEFILDPATAAAYGLSDGESYEIAVFHAERQPEGSSFKIRLEGFQDDACR